MEKFASLILKKRNMLFIVLTTFALICAYLMTQVVVNMDITEYLPADSNVKAGLQVMEAEFGELNTSALHIMFEGLTDDERLLIYSQLTEFENVVEVVFDAESTSHVLDEFTLYTLTLAQSMTTDEEYALVNTISDEFTNHTLEMSGDIAGVDIDVNMMLITVPTVIILIIILLLMCHSWFEPVIFFINIGIAILINMGTNIMFNSISDITQMIAGLLQVVLSMDYSIIFLNRYRQEKEAMAKEDHLLAMKNTILNSFNTISGISFTTIVGMLMLVFMSFTIGADIGLVIAKGVFISLICVFGVMPALILLFDKVIDKTNKPAISLKMGIIGRFSFNGRYVVLIAFVVLFSGAFWLQRNLEITYSEVDYDPVHQIFALDNTFVVLYENADEENISAFIAGLDGEGNIIAIYSSSMLEQYLTEVEMASALEMDEMIVGLVFRNYFLEDPPVVILADFLQFLEAEVAHNPLFADEMPAMEQFGDIQLMIPQQMMAEEFTSEQLAEVLQMDEVIVSQLLYLYNFTNGETLAEEMELAYFINYLATDFAQIPMFEPFFAAEGLAELEMASYEMVAASEMFVAENFSRMMINTTFDFESEETFAFMDQLTEELDDALTGDFYILGTSAMPHEMSQTFPGEYSFITILTTIAFFVVAAITFKSLGVAAILAIAIQAAVFITTGVTYFQDGGIMFLPLIIAQVLLKSRVIDYGILYTANYIEARKEHDVKDAIINALNRSIDTILTSGLIIVLVTFVVGLLFMGVNVAISEILLLIAQGCFIGVMLSIFVLPSLIAVFDRFVVKAKTH